MVDGAELGSLRRYWLWEDEFGNDDLPTCCSNPKLIHIEDPTGEWFPTAYLLTDYDDRDSFYSKCQKCMEQLIYQQYGLHTDLSKLQSLDVLEFCPWLEEGKWDVILELDGQETQFDEVTTFAEALRLLETKFNKIKPIK